jgi:alpha-1,3-mannosyltransferase
MLLLCVSKRVHSLFVLRLFNDPVAMLPLYAAVLLAMHDRWTLASLGLTLAVSVKMNVLAFVPAYGMLLVERFGLVRTLPHVALCVAVQVSLAAPFLARNAASYVAGAFDFGRQFLYVWTVNWKFVPEHVFLDRRLAAGLLLAHLAVLAWFFFTRWSRCVAAPAMCALPLP